MADSFLLLTIFRNAKIHFPDHSECFIHTKHSIKSQVGKIYPSNPGWQTITDNQCRGEISGLFRKELRKFNIEVQFLGSQLSSLMEMESKPVLVGCG